MEIQSALTRKLYKIPGKKTVTFNDCILGIYGSNMNDFQALPHAFPSQWLTLYLHVLEGLKMFLQISRLFLTEITWDKNYPYILPNKAPTE